MERIKIKTWFSADTHFDHARIIEYCNRPFKSVKEMNDALVKNWNGVVGENDLVIFLGDFAFQKKHEQNIEKWISLLHGHKTFIRGNHDRNRHLSTKIFSLVLHVAGTEIFCVHNPRNWDSNYKINLVGHVHEKWAVQRRGKSILVNVGVDVWDYYPIDIEDILRRMKEKKRVDKYCMPNNTHEFLTYPRGKKIKTEKSNDRCKHCGRFRFQIERLEK